MVNSVIITYEKSENGDHSIMLVGEKDKGVIDVIGTFENEEADFLWKKLNSKREKFTK